MEHQPDPPVSKKLDEFRLTRNPAHTSYAVGVVIILGTPIIVEGIVHKGGLPATNTILGEMVVINDA